MATVPAMGTEDAPGLVPNQPAPGGPKTPDPAPKPQPEPAKPAKG